MKILYFSAVGYYGLKLLPDILTKFQGADKVFINYEGAINHIPSTVDTGNKWQLAKKHLHPDAVKEYDYIFIWDDDLKIEAFDLNEYIAACERNQLSISQPSLSWASYFSHHITLTHPYPVGRITDFVEIMCPVYSRAGWAQFYPFLDDDNPVGWGYDFVPLPKKGIFDKFVVIHTKPIASSANPQVYKDAENYMKKYNLQGNKNILGQLI